MLEPMAETDRLAELENMLRRLPVATRSALLKGITDLFLDGRFKYKPSQIALFDRLFGALVEDVDAESAAALARRLAPIANTPSEIIRRLAQSDDITVAEPVLLRSPCIPDSVLVETARTKGPTHLLAIACRPQLAAAIVDVLIARGDEIAVRYVANNRGAQISETSAVVLAEHATRDDVLAELISKRSDIPAQLRTASALARGKTTAAA